jgi:hypothetical protein
LKWQYATTDQLQKYNRILKKANEKGQENSWPLENRSPQFGPNWALARTGQPREIAPEAIFLAINVINCN